MRRWFLPETTDVLALLRRQAAVTVAGLEDFLAWSAGSVEHQADVRRAEHEADEVRRELQAALRAAFSTPLDAEDLYELSERLDRVLNGAKNAVREATVMEMAPDEHLAAMARSVLEATEDLARAFAHLGDDPDGATAAADRAKRAARAIERSYREAMSRLLSVEDLREVMGRRELYRRYARVGDAVVSAAERVWYAVVKTT